MVLHYAPSILAHTHNLTAVLFPECEDPLVERPDNKPECMFAPSRMAKVTNGQGFLCQHLYLS